MPTHMPHFWPFNSYIYLEEKKPIWTLRPQMIWLLGLYSATEICWPTYDGSRHGSVLHCGTALSLTSSANLLYLPCCKRLRLCLNMFANVFKRSLRSNGTHFPTTALTWVRISPTYWSICAWKQETVCLLILGFVLADIPWCSDTNLMLLIDHRHGKHGDHSCGETGNV